MPESQLSSIIDVYPECGKGGQSCGAHIFVVLVFVHSWTENSEFCQNIASWPEKDYADKGTYPPGWTT